MSSIRVFDSSSGSKIRTEIQNLIIKFFSSPTGFSLAFGAMFSKTWRVHSIFTDLKLNKKVIKDYQLFMVVGVLLAIDLAIMTTWQVADPFFRETKQMEPMVS